ncbi:MAG TPA: ankyrin repeat domain-containing protein [Patescibacteria group bacterium]|nr:ankyrin repeat domain-containing protein [Patescibacteria group bacterium]
MKHHQDGLDEQLVEAAKLGDVAKMAACVDAGAQINSDAVDYSPLVWAAQNGHAGAVRWLLGHGAEVDKRKPNNQWTPLMSGVSSGNLEVLQLLLDAGADRRLRNSDGKDVVQMAREKGGAVAELIGQTPDEVIFFDQIADRIVQEVYSFRRLERFTFIRPSEHGTVEAVQRERFAAIAEDSGLRRAFNEHVKRGGALTEEEVFGDLLVKPRRALPVPRP